MSTSSRRRRHFDLDNVGLEWREPREQLVTLPDGNVVPAHRRAQDLHQPKELRLGDVKVRVRITHRGARVMAAPARELADERCDQAFRPARVHAFERRTEARIGEDAVDHIGDDRLHDRRAAHPDIKRPAHIERAARRCLPRRSSRVSLRLRGLSRRRGRLSRSERRSFRRGGKQADGRNGSDRKRTPVMQSHELSRSTSR